jgi:hypothetical protein
VRRHAGAGPDERATYPWPGCSSQMLVFDSTRIPLVHPSGIPFPLCLDGQRLRGVTFSTEVVCQFPIPTFASCCSSCDLVSVPRQI